ncbi:T9SS type A sorting domain-containing protein [Reichenbachiella versicolor]|uniref:T9SS type A sorting domain-containing protein n=1 Tax=Reichenbachiella versicolor TaxID=1821036 RepID=UPI000D6E868E|nr:T9SS type A sorting domain-containing protein [Reichenbachiella versicolor]
MKSFLIVILTFVISSAQAQIFIRPIEKPKKAISKQRTLETDGVLSLPFWDDFSFSESVPDTLWEAGSDVHINATWAIDPPSINVATFDGTTREGFTHRDTVSFQPVLCDVLVSRPIDLSGLTDANDVVLSFFLQRGGNGYMPSEGDYFSVHFLDSDNKWNEILRVDGGDDLVSDSTEFIYEAINITEPKYLHDCLQFKFENVGSPTGMFDAWHLDYVYMNAKRFNVASKAIIDQTIATPVSKLFSNYTMITKSMWNGFANDLFEELSFSIYNLGPQDRPAKYDYNLYSSDTVANTKELVYTESFGDDGALTDSRSLDDETGRLEVGKHLVSNIPALSTDKFLIETLSEDTLFLTSEVIYTEVRDKEKYFKDQNGIDIPSETYNFTINDTSRVDLTILNSLAYDDGTAEVAAGGRGFNTRLAIEFNIPVTDYVEAVDIYFPKIVNATGAINNSFNLLITNKLTVTDAASILTSGNFASGFSSINEFQRFTFGNTATVNGTFYIIFEQKTDEYFPIGLDKNTSSMSKMTYNTGGLDWFEGTDVMPVGSLMIRPVFGEENAAETVVSSKNIIKLYPNPASNFIQIDGEFQRYSLRDMSGNEAKAGTEKKVDISSFSEGIYILNVVTDEYVNSQKIMIAH